MNEKRAYKEGKRSKGAGRTLEFLAGASVEAGAPPREFRAVSVIWTVPRTAVVGLAPSRAALSLLPVPQTRSGEARAGFPCAAGPEWCRWGDQAGFGRLGDAIRQAGEPLP